MCNYCSGEVVCKNFSHGFKKIFISHSDSLLHIIEKYKDNIDYIDVSIKYCPFCGRKLED